MTCGFSERDVLAGHWAINQSGAEHALERLAGIPPRVVS